MAVNSAFAGTVDASCIQGFAMSRDDSNNIFGSVTFKFDESGSTTTPQTYPVENADLANKAAIVAWAIACICDYTGLPEA